MTDFSMFAGTNRDIVIEVYELDGVTPADLSTASVVWALATNATPFQIKFTKHSNKDGEIDLLINPADQRESPPPSVIWVHLLPIDTDALLGDYLHEARVTIDEVQEVVYSSSLTISESITYGE